MVVPTKATPYKPVLPQRSGGLPMRKAKRCLSADCKKDLAPTLPPSTSPPPRHHQWRQGKAFQRVYEHLIPISARTLPLHHHGGSNGGRLANWQQYSLGPSLLVPPFHSFVTSILLLSSSKDMTDLHLKQFHNQINMTFALVIFLGAKFP